MSIVYAWVRHRRRRDGPFWHCRSVGSRVQGANSHGQLAMGDVEDRHVATRVPLPPGVRLARVTGGAGHTVAIDADGRVWRSGAYVGADAHPVGVTTWTAVNVPSARAMAAHCGWNFALILCADDAAVVGIGLNAHGPLSDLPPSARAAAGGLRHALFVMDDGRLVGRGADRHGQLADCHLIPRAASVAAGEHHSLALSIDGLSVWAWGSNRRGQLGIPAGAAPSSRPHRVPLPLHDDERVIDVASGWTFCVAMTSRGRVLSWGRGDYGQLGRSADAADWQVRLPRPASAIACGAEHAIALTDDGAVYAWGWNDHGCCGTGDTQQRETPVRVDGIDHRAIAIGCGSGTSWALCE